MFDPVDDVAMCVSMSIARVPERATLWSRSKARSPLVNAPRGDKRGR
jgi:hypothetical protein